MPDLRLASIQELRGPPAALLVDPARRLENDVALYFFKVPGPRRAVLNGRLLVIPTRLVKLSDVPTATSFLAGPTTYKTGYCTTAWVDTPEQ